MGVLYVLAKLITCLTVSEAGGWAREDCDHSHFHKLLSRIGTSSQPLLWRRLRSLPSSALPPPFLAQPAIPVTSTTPTHKTNSAIHPKMASSAPKGWTDTEKVSASATAKSTASVHSHSTGQPLPPDHRQSWSGPVAGAHSAGRPYRQGLPSHARQGKAEDQEST